MNCWMVTWKKKPFPLPFLLDFDDETLAVKASVALSEIGRYDVAITTCEYEEDAEMKARIWKRVQERMQEMPAVVGAMAV